MNPAVRSTLVTGLIVVALVAAAVLLPAGLRWIPLVLLGLLIALNVAAFLLTARARRTAGGGIAALHPDATVLPTSLLAHDGSSSADRARVVAVVADAAGLSFRDARNAEFLLIPAERILSIELAPFDQRSPMRPIRVATIDGAPVDFWGGASADQQVDAVVAVRTALGRSSA